MKIIILIFSFITTICSQDDFTVPVFNTTQIHAIAAVEFALSTK
jgi:aspartate/glutamate racemase